MKWATCDIPTIADEYVGVFDSSVTKKQIIESFKRRVARELRRRGFDRVQYEYEWDAAMECVENNLEVTSMRANKVYEIDFDGSFK